MTIVDKCEDQASVEQWPSQGPEAGPQPLQVLVLDDNRYDLAVMGRLAGKAGIPMRVVPAQTMAEFREQLDCSAFDLAIVDYNLPGASGADAVQALKAHPVNAPVPVIMLSGESNTETVVRAFRAGCVNYLEKSSLNPERLQDAVFEALNETLTQETAALEVRLRQATFKVLEGVSDACFDEMRPILARMFRHLDALRSVPDLDRRERAHMLSALEDGCMTLWRFVDELATYKDAWRPQMH